SRYYMGRSLHYCKALEFVGFYIAGSQSLLHSMQALMPLWSGFSRCIARRMYYMELSLLSGLLRMWAATNVVCGLHGAGWKLGFFELQLRLLCMIIDAHDLHMMMGYK
ncbi:hypothetical protein Dimus_007410, partial [Dionaea muscipula]